MKLATKIGIAQAARDLTVYESRIYAWRNVASAESAKLRRQLAEQAKELEILKKAATYFAKNQK